MDEALGNAFFVGSIFALIALYSAYLSSGTKMHFFVFHTFHIVIFSILFLGAFYYFDSFRTWLSTIFKLELNLNYHRNLSFLFQIPIMCLLTSPFAREVPRMPILAILYSIVLLSISTGLYYLSSLYFFVCDLYMMAFGVTFFMFAAVFNTLFNFIAKSVVKKLNSLYLFYVDPEDT